jgi:hypothetical protein
MRLFILLALLVGTGCAAYKTYNKTASGIVIFTGGVHKKKSWDDKLFLDRLSWYHGVTLYYDLILWKADIDSPFANWFSAQEKEFFVKCEHLLVAAAYSADPAKISHVNAREQMKLNGYDDVVINNFASSFKAHPSAVDWKLENYKVMGYCKRSPSRLEGGNLQINFPGFEQVEVDL